MARGLDTVSVVIPCRNQAAFAAEAVASARAQADVEVQVVVVDDGSTDGTGAVLERLRGDIDVLVRRAHGGVSSARNAGMAAGDGDFFVFLDADDRLLPGGLRAGVAALRSRPDCALAVGRHRRIDAAGRRLPDDERGDDIAARPTGSVYEGLLHGNFVHTAAVIYRRAPLERVGGFDPQLDVCEDWQLYLRLTRQLPAVLHGAVVSEYRAHDDQATARRTADLLRTGLALLDSQRRLLRGPRERAAWRDGRRFWRRFYGYQLLGQVRADLRARRPGAALRHAAVLLRHAPAYVLASAARGLGRSVGLGRRTRS